MIVSIFSSNSVNKCRRTYTKQSTLTNDQEKIIQEFATIKGESENGRERTVCKEYGVVRWIENLYIE